MAALNLQWCRKWGIVLGGIAGLQLLVQFLSALTGWMIVRLLPPAEYALFTLAGSVQATLSLMSDLGLSVAFLSVGGAVWQDPRQLGSVRSAVLMKRRVFALLASFVGFPAGWVLLVHNGASGWYAAALLLTTLTCLHVVPVGLVDAGTLRLHQKYSIVQTSELGAAFIRLVVSAAVALPATCLAIVATVATALSQVFYTRQVSARAASLVEFGALPSDSHQKAVSEIVRSLSAPALFHCFQGQLTTWILGISGQENAVASLGALMRFAILFTLSGVVVTNVVGPAIARCATPAELRTKVATAVGAYALYSTLIFASVWITAPWALWLLGPSYQTLRLELLLALVNLSISGLASLVWCVLSSRQWVAASWVTIPLTLGTQLSAATVLPVSRIDGILLFSCITALPSLFWYAYLFSKGYREFARAYTPSPPDKVA